MTTPATNPYFPVVPHCSGLNCQNTKPDAVNHWFMIKTSTTKRGGRKRVVVLDWDRELEGDLDVLPICGLECLHKEIDRLLLTDIKKPDAINKETQCQTMDGPPQAA